MIEPNGAARSKLGAVAAFSQLIRALPTESELMTTPEPSREASKLALRDVAEILDRAKLRFTLDAEERYIRTTFTTDHYRDDDGAARVAMYLTVRDQGELLLVDLPYLYRLSDARDKGAARKVLLYSNYCIKSVVFCVDPGDADEVRMRLEVWLEGTQLTAPFLKAQLVRVAAQIDYCDRLIRPVWKRGRRELRALIARNMKPVQGRGGNQDGGDTSKQNPNETGTN